MKPESSDANEAVGTKREKQQERKTDTKEIEEGSRPPKAAQHWGPFQITAAVGVNQVVSINNVRLSRANVLSALTNPHHQHLPDSPPSTSPLWPHESD